MIEIEVKIHGLTMDPKNNSPVILLKETASQRALPIWIGTVEANSIATAMAGLEPPRPMTHDLLHNAILAAGYHVSRVVITELTDNTFYAVIHLDSDNGMLELDSRPSDAIALAVRSHCPIFVNKRVFEQSGIDLTILENSETASEKDEWLEMLESMDPEDYSKYKM
ncbi:MAG: bifunctional nuclease family protein [bacterium]|nr:bifunctional nuclease family protein [bacterium]